VKLNAQNPEKSRTAFPREPILVAHARLLTRSPPHCYKGAGDLRDQSLKPPNVPAANTLRSSPLLGGHPERRCDAKQKVAGSDDIGLHQCSSPGNSSIIDNQIGPGRVNPEALTIACTLSFSLRRCSKKFFVSWNCRGAADAPLIYGSRRPHRRDMIEIRPAANLRK